MAEQYLMAFDASTGAGRCFLISLNGRKFYSSFKEWSYFTPLGLSPSASEFDHELFWKILADCCRAVMEKAGVSPQQVAAVSSSSQREAVVILDKQGREVYCGPNRDFRAAMEGIQISSKYGETIYQRSGHYPTGIFAVARMLWFKKNQPEKYQQFTTLLSMNDWVLYRLSGECACEPTNASETALYDIVKGEWSKDLLMELDLKDIFPPVYPAGKQIGKVSQAVAQQTGLMEGTPVVIGAADTQCGLLGCGLTEPEQMAIVSGTTTPIQMISTSMHLDAQIRTWVCPYVIPGKYVTESNSGITGTTYQWLRNTMCELEKTSSSDGEGYTLMDELAEKAPPGANGVMTHVGVTIFNARKISIPPAVLLMGLNPFSNPIQSSKSLIIRALLEGLAFGVKANADQIIEVAGSVPNRIAVCGGLSKARLYNQIIANSMQMPLEVPLCAEGSGVGACICAGIGAGIFGSFEEGVKSLVHTKEIIQPDAEVSRQYKSIYRKWLKSYLEFAK